MISGQPKLILRLEGLVLFAAGLAAFLYLKQSVWIFAGLFLVPDLSMAAYFTGPKLGSFIYNSFHTTIGPVLLAIYGVLFGELFAQVLASIWLAHIGLDRAIGYGLKYATDFKDTHLGRIGGPTK
jgi:surface polysaccharide O-acyltransferase-like enzyme